MKATFIIFLLLFSFIMNATGQKILTKDEIYFEWNKHKSIDSIYSDSIKIISFDESQNLLLHKIIDSLKEIKIDSIIVYSVAYPGAVWLDNKCITGIAPVYTNIFWKNKNITKGITFEGSCHVADSNFQSTILFDYFETYKTQLSTEIFMPRIYKGMKLKRSIISFSISILDHEANYILFLKMGNKVRIHQFSQSDLDDTASLFQKDNLNLKSYQLILLIQKQMGIIKLE